MNQIEQNQSEQISRKYEPPKLEQHPAWKYVIGFAVSGGGREIPQIPVPSVQTDDSK